MPIKLLCRGMPLLICISLCACGGRGSRPDLDSSEGARAEQLHSASAVLTLLPETAFGGGDAGKLSLSETRDAEGVVLQLRSEDARDLKALFLRFEFDSGQFHSGELSSSWALGPEDECLSLKLDNGEGLLEYGEMLARPQDAAGGGGFSGDGLLCTLHLKDGPGGAPALRAARAAPLGDGASSLLNVDSDGGALRWTYRSPGDYNQNGEVSVTDLTPIGIHFNEDVPENGEDSIQAVIDGNGDGKVAVADLTAIGLNFQARAASYNVYASLSADDFPAENDGANGPGAELTATVTFSAAIGSAIEERLRFSSVLENPRDGWFYWVRPNDAADGGGSDGTPSSLASFGGGIGNETPSAVVVADPLSGDAPLLVTFDGSGSSDPDGATGTIADIVQFSWDFDGDGNVDLTSTEPKTEFEYTQEGSFKAVLVVTDAGAATNANNALITVGGAQNTAPSAALEAEPLSGGLPLMVQLDGSASSDDGGLSALTFDWDFDGDGSFDASTGNVPTVLHTYVSAGSFNAKLRVSDQFGLSGEAEVSLEAVAGGGDPPTAVITVPQFGGDFNSSNQAPHQFNFSIDESSDVAPGQIVFYQFDFEGDGVFDFEGPNPFTNESPNTGLSKDLGPGQYTATLLVTDDSGNTDTATFAYKYTVDNNLPPVCVFDIEKTTLEIEEIVPIFCSGSSDDTDNFLEFDIDKFGTDEFVFIGTTDGDSFLQYLEAGVFRCTVRVTDNEGLTDFESRTITVINPGNQAPQPVIGIGASSGSAPFVTSLDDTGSSDPDGVIELYEWDTTGDGLPEFVSETPSVFDATFRNKGVTTVTLRVTDNEGLSATTTTQVTLDSGWTFSTVASGVKLNTNTSAAFISRSLAGDVSSNIPAVSFATFDTRQLGYAQADPQAPENWGVPVQVVPPGLVDGFVCLAEVQDRPALAFQYFDGEAGGPAYIRAASDSGLSWGDPLLLEGLGRNGGFSPDLKVINGTPALLYSAIFPASSFPTQFYQLGADPLGAGFLPRVLVTSVGVGGESEHLINSQLLQVAGRPMAFTTRSAIFLSFEAQGRRANDSQGTDWGSGQSLFSTFDSQLFSLSAALVDDQAALAATRNSFELSYVRAVDSLGSFAGAEESSVFQDPTGDALHSCDLAVAAGRPLIAFESASSGDLLLSVAADITGASWNEPLRLDQAGQVGSFASLASTADDVLITYYDSTNKRVKAAVFTDFVLE